MEIEFKEIERLEKLSKLSFDDDKLKSFKKEFEKIADFVEQVKKFDCGDDINYDRVLTVDQLRNDDINPSMKTSEILLNAPEKENGAFVVPKVVE